MTYYIDRAALDDFLARQVELVESTPVPADLAALTSDGCIGDGLTADELQAVWLAAGLAALVGTAITEQPERFLAQRPHVVLTAV